MLPNLVIGDLKDAIMESKAPVVYINNIMTQPGETDEYTAFDHVLAILDHTYDSFIDYCIVNTGKISGAAFSKSILMTVRVLWLMIRNVSVLQI